VSDYLTDLKLSFSEKEKIRVLAVGSEVLWVIGYRMGDSAKLSDETENILKVVLEAKNG
jgi:tRNA(Ile)-lysidine synthase